MKKILAFSYRDLKDLSRDPLLFIAILVPLLITLLIRFGIPLIAEILLDKLEFDLTVHYQFIVGFLLMMTPMMIGMLVGFIILDERDENMLLYYSVTPLTKSGYLILRVLNPMILSFLLSSFLLPLTNLVEMNYFKLIPVNILTALEAPIIVLFLGVFAENKVEGLALSKATGLLFLAPLAAYLLVVRWEVLLGIFPTYWVIEAFLASFGTDNFYWLYLVGGVFCHLFYLYLFYKKFTVKVD